MIKEVEEIIMQNNTQVLNSKKNLSVKKSFIKSFKKEWELLALILPGIIFFIVFRYGPMYGVSIAFKDYGPFLGIGGSPWVGLKHFNDFFSSNDFFVLFKNTLLLGLYSIVWSFPFPIIFAVLLNEVRNRKIKKITQTISYLPAFLSVVVVCSMAIDMLSPNNGIINRIISMIGFEEHYFIIEPKWYRTIYIATDIWQNMGFSAIIYIAAITNIDTSLYQAAEIDGCSRFKMIWHITLPSILPTIMTMLILKTGQVFRIGPEKALLLYTPLTHDVADIFGTYVYRKGIGQAQHSFAAAVGLFEATVSLSILYLANTLSRKLSESSLW